MKFDVNRALSHRIVLLTGDEGALRHAALGDLVKAASEGDDFDVETFVGDSSSPMQWLASCGTAPFLSPRRVAIVRNVLRNEDWSELGKPELPDTSLLILVADEESSGSDDRKWINRNTSWMKAIEKVGLVYKFSVDAKAFATYVQQAAAEQGKKFNSAGLELFGEMTSQNLSHALGELEKLTLYVGDSQQITDRDVRAVVVPSREYNIFGLVDAVLAGKGGVALEQLRLMVGNNPRVEGPAMREVFPNLSRQFRMIWQARLVLDAGGRQNSIPKAASDLFPSHQNFTQQKEYPQKLAVRAAERLSLRQIGRCLDVLVTAEARIKGLEPTFSAQDALEMMVLELVGAVRT